MRGRTLLRLLPSQTPAIRCAPGLSLLRPFSTDLQAPLPINLINIMEQRMTAIEQKSAFLEKQLNFGMIEESSKECAFDRAIFPDSHVDISSCAIVSLSSKGIFLIGICLPLYVIHSNDKPWNMWDLIATVIRITGIIVAYFADTQLYSFMQRNEALKQCGEPLVLNLDKGLLQYSRHPNYFIELLWWWGLCIFAWNVTMWARMNVYWSLVNSLCLAYVTVLVERIMLEQEHRAEAYKKYQKRTSLWIPWFKIADGEVKPKKS